MKTSKKNLLAVLAVITLSLLTVGCSLLSPLIVVAEDNARREQMDNPYVNSNYAGWSRVVFFEKHTFELPETWYSVQLDDSTYALYQGETVIAYFGKLGGDSQYAETSDFCAAVVGSEEIATPYEQAGSETFGNGCLPYQLTATKSNSEQEKFFYLFSHRLDEKGGMVFLNDVFDQTTLFDYVIAIGYSYELQ